MKALLGDKSLQKPATQKQFNKEPQFMSPPRVPEKKQAPPKIRDSKEHLTPTNQTQEKQNLLCNEKNFNYVA